MLIDVTGLEEEASDSYYANDSYDDGYSPSPPRASGGAGGYYPETNAFPPPPIPTTAGYTQQHTTTTTVPPVDPHIQYPPYNPADYVGPQQPMDQYGYPAPRDDRAGGNVSSAAPYQPFPQAPIPQSRNLYTTEEGACCNIPIDVFFFTIFKSIQQPRLTPVQIV